MSRGGGELLANQIALISGGAQGIGRTIAERFQREGAQVVLLDCDLHVGNAAATELSAQLPTRPARFLAANLESPAEVKAAVAQLKSDGRHLDILVNNAGIEIDKPFHEITLDDWDSILNINLRGAFLLSQAALPLFPVQGGAIINISSIHATTAFPNSLPYACSKAALLTFGRNLALELAPRKIRVNTLCPGYIDTRLWDKYVRSAPKPAELAAHTALLHPLGRRGLPADVASAALFLASDEAAFITGTSLVVDGGLTIRTHP